ncbi:MAG: aminomethyl-transferring glycine dehydrogenase [Crocinitomicaceae bacterium]
MSTKFSHRHIGPNAAETQEMISAIGVKSIDELIDKTIPSEIRLAKDLEMAPAMTEQEYLNHIQELASKNKLYDTYIGLGYHPTVTPSVILRNVLENPGWYTAYTPYQAEISQGRLEALLNFQTMISDLTGMEIANASLLDEATAATEAMIMFFNSRSRAEIKEGKNKFFISKNVFPQTIDCLEGRAKNLGIELIIEDPESFAIGNEFFGALVQYTNKYGEVINLESFIAKAHAQEVKVAVGADVMSLVLLKSPGSLGADVVFGNTQRFGVPMGYGGPHAAFFATKEDYKRHIPGRIIGVSIDADGNRALRMALQTREQHIKRDKATSNICTAQALLAVMAGMYVCYHGPKGMREIAESIHKKTSWIATELDKLGYKRINNKYFDTVSFESSENIKAIAEKNGINLAYFDGGFSIAMNEVASAKDLANLYNVFAEIKGANSIAVAEFDNAAITLSTDLRKDEIFTHEVFNSHHSESQMMRYLKKLENKDISLVHSMISLGSCTMKLNAASELMPITWPEFANLHPFVPIDQAQGYQEMFEGLENDLCEVTGFAGMSLQPNSGAQGEYAGLAVIRAYHEDNGDHHRNIVLIPSSAHGTNPASAVMAGMEVVVVKCDDDGNIDSNDLKEKAEQYSNELAALMITYPSTHGVYEEGVREMTAIIHQHGGQVYMDGANMNAQVALTNPGNIGADVCHLNLHKTFAIPHGGGGPGVGPIGVAAHLVPFLPSNAVIPTGGAKAIHGISAAHHGSALVTLISYAYIKMLGAEGLKDSTKMAIVNANYLKSQLEGHYSTLYSGKNNTVAHEMILDCRDFKKTAGVEVADIAKRLIDYGFHAPTVSFPVAGTLMVEPTESEDKAELDRFILAMKQIREEIREIEEGKADKEDNVLKNAPHTADCLIKGEWKHAYSKEQAAYPVSYLNDWKYWVPVRRVDNAHGDRNLICTCPSIEEYEIA